MNCWHSKFLMHHKFLGWGHTVTEKMTCHVKGHLTSAPHGMPVYHNYWYIQACRTWIKTWTRVWDLSHWTKSEHSHHNILMCDNLQKNEFHSPTGGGIEWGRGDYNFCILYTTALGLQSKPILFLRFRTRSWTQEGHCTWTLVPQT